MQVGFTADEASHMFDSLSREVFRMFGYEQPITFKVMDNSNNRFRSGAMAYTDFSDYPDDPYNVLKVVQPYATGIRISEEVLPWVYEDEMIHIILHELTHVTAGLAAQHYMPWQDHARAVGTVPYPFMVIRNWREAYTNDAGAYETGRMYGPTLDHFAGSL